VTTRGSGVDERLRFWLEALEEASTSHEWVSARGVVEAAARLREGASRATGVGAGANLRRLEAAGYVESRQRSGSKGMEWRQSDEGRRLLTG